MPRPTLPRLPLGLLPSAENELHSLSENLLTHEPSFSHPSYCFIPFFFGRQASPVVFPYAVSDSPFPVLFNPLSSHFSPYHSIKLSLAEVTNERRFGKSCNHLSFFILPHLAGPTKPATLPYWWEGPNSPPMQTRGQGTPTRARTGLGLPSKAPWSPGTGPAE